MRIPRHSIWSAVFAAALLAACEHDPLPGSGSGAAFSTAPFLGVWVGTWTNVTTSTSGTATFEVDTNGTDVLAIRVDLDGNVFGAGDPPAQTFVFTVGTSAATMTAQTTTTYGQVSGRLEADGAFSAEAANVPIGTVRSFTLVGDWLATDIELDATLTYAPGSSPDTARAVLRLSKR